MTKHSNTPRTEKGHQSREQILETAFQLFLREGYEKATIAELINMSGMSRGAIFYYYKDKFALFKAVIEKYVFASQVFATHIDYSGDITLWEAIQSYLDGIEEMFNHFGEIMSRTRPEPVDYYPGLYYRLLFHASHLYPGFMQHVAGLLEEEGAVWCDLIRKDMARGTIRDDIDASNIAVYLRYIHLGLSLEYSFNGKEYRIAELRQLYADIYNLIRK